ncbi:hypothetical protein AX15_001449 [Amanita polypyramis BW_CC]|nr:hypothetical protein AX15_001449 [Amanita polypyramis BW_CC]
MSAFARCLSKRALFIPRTSLRAFHSPYVVLRDSPLTAPPPPSSAVLSMYEKQHDHPAEPFVTYAGTRTYVVSEPDASAKYYQVPSGAYPMLAPYVDFASTEASSIAGAQMSSTSSRSHTHSATVRTRGSSVVSASGSSGTGMANQDSRNPLSTVDVAGGRRVCCCLATTMTLLIPLGPIISTTHSPPFLRRSHYPDSHVATVVKAIMKAKRIVVICGAGISVQAGIPDFRSPEGLFKSIKRGNPREALASGKELFDASVFNSEHSTTLFYKMIARLSELSEAAKPTAFHDLLRKLDDSGRLLRVYTQNIDAIELKCGLSFGIPEFDDRRSSKYKSKSTTSSGDATTLDFGPHRSGTSLDAPATGPPGAPIDTPRCIPLHGTLRLLHCQACNRSFPLEDHLTSLLRGLPPECPECLKLERTRQLAGKRSRGVGKLRPSVVLYNEAHRDGEGVGQIVHKDLVGSSKGKGRSGADLLLVVGTSLRVPGTKRMVREFAKAVRCRGPSTLLTCHNSPASENSAVKAIYLNLDFPVPAREWEGVFDVWMQGDAQHFAELLNREIDEAAKSKELGIQRKRRRIGNPSDPTEEKESTSSNELDHTPSAYAGLPFSSEVPPQSAKSKRILPSQHMVSSTKLVIRIRSRRLRSLATAANRSFPSPASAPGT